MARLLLLLIVCFSCSVSAQNVLTEIHYTFDVFQRNGTLLFEQHKEVTSTIAESNGTFYGFFEVEPFYMPITRTEISGSKDLNGFVTERWEDLEMRDVFIDDTRLHQYRFTDVLKGDEYTAEYWYQETPIDWFPVVRIPSSNEVKSVVVTLYLPNSVSVVPHIVFPSDTIEYTVDVSGNDCSISFENIPEIPSVFGIDQRQPRATILFELHMGEKVYTPNKPQDFARWYRQQFPYSLPTDVDPTLASRAVSDSKHGWERIDSAFQFVRSNIRYIAQSDGINSIVPSKPNEVLQRGWGDCKDKAFLLSSLCRDNSIPVYPVLVHTKLQSAFPDKTHVSLYNHVIVATVEGNDTVYADPTNSVADFGTLSSSLYGSSAMFLDMTEPRLVKLPKLDSDTSLHVNIQLESNQANNLNGSIQAHSFHASQLRALFLHTSENKRPEELTLYVQQFFRNLTVERVRTLHDDGRYITIDCVFDVSGFLITGSKNSYVSSMPFNVVSPKFIDRNADSLPLVLNSVCDVALTLEFHGRAHVVEAEPYTYSTPVSHFSVQLQQLSENEHKQRIAFRAYRGVETLRSVQKKHYVEAMRGLIGYRNKLIEISWKH